MANYVVAIDGSTTATGIAVFQATKKTYRLVWHGRFEAPKRKPPKKVSWETKTARERRLAEARNAAMQERVLYMMKNIAWTLDKFRPFYIVMEDAYAERGAIAVTKALARIQGAAMECGRKYNTEVVFVMPAAWRKTLGIRMNGKGNTHLKREELKQLSVEKVAELYGEDVTDDEADAICIGLSVKEQAMSVLPGKGGKNG